MNKSTDMNLEEFNLFKTILCAGFKESSWLDRLSLRLFLLKIETAIRTKQAASKVKTTCNWVSKNKLKSATCAGSTLSGGILGYGIYKYFNKNTNTPESDPIVEREDNAFLKPKI